MKAFAAIPILEKTRMWSRHSLRVESPSPTPPPSLPPATRDTWLADAPMLCYNRYELTATEKIGGCLFLFAKSNGGKRKMTARLGILLLVVK